MAEDVLGPPTADDVIIENIGRCAREVQIHFTKGNSAAYGLGWRLYEVWIRFLESDPTCSKAQAYERLAEWVDGLGLDPETSFIPNAAQLRYIVEHIAEREDCDLGMLF
jgi:hypothetical protein